MCFVSACGISMYSCEIRVGDTEEMQLEEKKKKCKNGEKTLAD